MKVNIVHIKQLEKFMSREIINNLQQTILVAFPEEKKNSIEYNMGNGYLNALGAVTSCYGGLIYM